MPGRFQVVKRYHPVSSISSKERPVISIRVSQVTTKAKMQIAPMKMTVYRTP